VNRFSFESIFLKHFVGKKQPHSGVLAGLTGSGGLKYGSKNTSIKMALEAIIRGAKLPYFGKKGDYWAYSPQEQKKTILRAFPVLPG
jgi:hypothetical protein